MTNVEGPLFSVIVPTYNRPEFLGECLASIAAQTIEDFECIVVDDGSNTAGPVIPADERFRLIALDTNRGVTHARQTGCDEATGQYLTFLDDDDQWTPNRLEIALEGLKQAPVAVCRSAPLTNPGAVPSGRVVNGDVADTILDGFTPNMGMTAIQRDRFVSLDLDFAAVEDVDWWLRQAAVTPVATVDKVGFLHRVHSGERNLNGVEARIDASLQLLDKHADYFAQHRDARAFRWFRIGMMRASIGDTAGARQAIWNSLKIRPTARRAGRFLRLLARRT